MHESPKFHRVPRDPKRLDEVLRAIREQTREREFELALYAGLLSLGCRRALFDLDQLLTGKTGAGYRMKDWQYGQAREAITTLYHLVKRPDLEPGPHAQPDEIERLPEAMMRARAAAKVSAIACGRTELRRARKDPAFQIFMAAALKPGRRRKGTR